MSIQPGTRTKLFTAFLFGLGLLLALTLVLADQTARLTSGAEGDPENPVPEMRLVITDPPDACVGTQCQIGTGDTFRLAVEIVTAPVPGYIQAGSYIRYGSNITYDPNAAPTAAEVLWPDCADATAVRAQIDSLLPIADRNNPSLPNSDEVVAHGCLAGLIPPLPVSFFVGLFVEISLTCSEQDTGNVIDLLTSEDPSAGTSGSLFTEPVGDGGFLQITPKVSGLNVFCGTPPTPTITPTITPGGPTSTPFPTPTITPAITTTPTPALAPTATFVSTFPCGDINGDRLVNAEDALWLLWFSSGMIQNLPNPGGVLLPGDVNGDGFVDPLDALLVLWIELNLLRCL